MNEDQAALWWSQQYQKAIARARAAEAEAETWAGLNLSNRKLYEVKLAAVEKETIRLRAALASSKDPCVYCQLPADEMGKCRSGFPGCARMDDLTGCPEFGAMMNEHTLREELDAVRAALAFYADGFSYWPGGGQGAPPVLKDHGARARAALSPDQEGGES